VDRAGREGSHLWLFRRAPGVVRLRRRGRRGFFGAPEEKMQTRRALSSLALVATVLAAAAGPAVAQNRAGFCGVVKYVGRNCVLVAASRAGTRDFDITGARPITREGEMIAGTGRMQGLSPCTHSNRHLIHVSWRKVTACPAAH